MKGYHYTAWEHWERIQREGLYPQWIIEENIRAVSRNTEGIWFYQSCLEGQELLGMLLSILGSKRCSCVCELEIDYQLLECIQAHDDEDILLIRYTAWVGHWDFVRDKPIGIIREYIPDSRVKLCRVWNLDQVDADSWNYENVFSCQPQNGQYCNLYKDECRTIT